MLDYEESASDITTEEHEPLPDELKEFEVD